MNLLDENFPDDQRELLLKFGIPVRQVGREIGETGMADSEIVPLLHRHRRVTFFTHDRDFTGAELCHPNYCLVWLSVKQDALADYARRLLRHPEFNTIAKRMGTALTVGFSGVTVRQRNRSLPRKADWTE